MRRRDFVRAIVGSATAWPLTLRAQQPAMPVIGFLYGGAPEPIANLIAAFRQGLIETGHVEGRNVAIEYRFARNELGQLPELAADLVKHKVAVIATPYSTPAALAAKATTSSIPIVFGSGGDPVEIGLVASLNRPGSNITGITTTNAQLAAKQLGLMHDLLPKVATIAALVNPISPLTKPFVTELQAARTPTEQRIEIVNASTNSEIDSAFSTVIQKKAEALLVGSDALFMNRRVQITTLAAYHRLPAIYPLREYAQAGGLMSYGAQVADLFRQTGVYTGRVLNGEKPADLPVMQSTKFEFVINLQTAKTLGLEMPAKLLALADEVIE